MAGKNIITRLILEDAGFAKKLDLSKKQVGEFDRKVSKVGKGVKSIVGSVFGGLGIGAAVGGFAAFAIGAQRAVSLAMEFEVKMSEMRSLTGLATEELNALKDAALQMSAKSGVAAGSIVETMKNVGGALPELLQFKEGLISVTEWVVTLSQASGLSMEEATKSFTTALNQFGAGAEMAGVYANTLAAAAQAGSAEIPYLAMALERVGGVAASLGMSFEDTVALIETVAPKFGSAEEAGTALKNMLLGMENAGGKVAISTNGFTGALDAYLAKQPSATQMMTDFGKSGLQAGLAVQANREELTRFQKEIVGTNAATEQAAINTDNLRGSLDVLSSKWDSFTLSVNNSNGILKTFVDFTAKAVEGLGLILAGEKGRIEMSRIEGGKEGVTEAGNRLSLLEKAGWTRKSALEMAKAEAEQRKLQYLAELNAPLTPRGGEPRNRATTPISGAVWKVQAQKLPESGVVPKVSAQPMVLAPKITRQHPLSEKERRELERKIAREESVIKTLEGMGSDNRPSKILDLDYVQDEPKKTKTGAKSTPTDPLENSRGLLAAAGLSPSDIAADMSAAKKVEGQIREIEAAIEAASNPQLKKQLRDLLETLKGKDVPPELDKVFKRLDELREKFAGAMPELSKTEIESLANSALEAELLTARIRDLETALSSVADPNLRERLQSTLNELRAPQLPNGMRRPDMQNTAFRTQLRADGQRLAIDEQNRRRTELLRPNNEWRDRRNDALGQGTSYAAIGFGTDVAGVGTNFVSSLGSAFSSLGLSELGESISSVSSTLSSLISVVSTASELINMVQSLTSAVAIPTESANTAALVANTGLLTANTAALGALTSTMTMNNVLGLIPGFAEGGVVGGTSFTGDKLLARVNSGERILTRRQQEHLGRALTSVQSSTAAGTSHSGSARIEVGGGYTVRGEDLFVALRNYTRRTGKTL